MNILLTVLTKVWFHSSAVTEPIQGGYYDCRNIRQQWDAFHGNEKKSTTKELQKVQVYLRFTGFCAILSCYSFTHNELLQNSNTFSLCFLCYTKQGWFNEKKNNKQKKPNKKPKPKIIKKNPNNKKPPNKRKHHENKTPPPHPTPPPQNHKAKMSLLDSETTHTNSSLITWIAHKIKS